MKIDKLFTFRSQIQEELGPKGIEVQLYYYFAGKWYELLSETHCDDMTKTLERTKKETISYHSTNSLDAWFYFSSTDCVVRLVFPKSPRAGTRRSNRKLLDKLHTTASNAYKVSHNQLTHLLAKDAFRERLTSAISEMEKREPTSDEVQESGIARELVVIALDIDHFKQVNDTWGHLYGDQVLKTFGRRLEICAEGIQSKGIGTPVIHLGHPSGEEFFILIQANVLREQFIEWANEFRKKIADEVLPTDQEWEWLTSSDSIGILSPPPLQERGITMSVGVAIYNSSSTNGPGTEVVSDLLDRADTALYRAKAGGRDQVIFYDEILSNCGRVIEQDKNTRVVALDIGSNVGVSIGQEFKVFSPTFSGKTKFLINDGRTTRTLGNYPRVESARIVVFNIQPEISFAYVASPTDSVPNIDSGSHLEAIPAGSIGHLLPSSSKYFPASTETMKRSTIKDLHEFVRSSVADTSGPFAVVIRFTRESECLRKYGTVALNMALAQVYREALRVFHTAKVVEVLDRSSICIAGTKDAYNESMVTEFVENMASELPELGIFAGIWCDADREASTAKGQVALDSVNAIEFARFAAADAGRLPDTRLRHFGYNVADDVLRALRESRSFDVAYADFERLRRLGVESGSLLNIGGVTAGSLGLYQQALEHYAAAIARDPEELIYKSNYGVAAARVGELDPALKILNALPLNDVDQLLTSHVFGYVTYARLLARAKMRGSAFFDASRFNHIANNALSVPGFEKSPESEIIREALEHS